MNSLARSTAASSDTASTAGVDTDTIQSTVLETVTELREAEGPFKPGRLRIHLFTLPPLVTVNGFRADGKPSRDLETPVDDRSGLAYYSRPVAPTRSFVAERSEQVDADIESRHRSGDIEIRRQFDSADDTTPRFEPDLEHPLEGR
ncbi:MAG: hypothetical protein ABEJ26_10095 [Halosimplex sp.]